MVSDLKDGQILALAGGIPDYRGDLISSLKLDRLVSARRAFIDLDVVSVWIGQRRL